MPGSDDLPNLEIAGWADQDDVALASEVVTNQFMGGGAASTIAGDCVATGQNLGEATAVDSMAIPDVGIGFFADEQLRDSQRPCSRLSSDLWPL